ncbi:hypothetical protein EELLY_v1c06010 [Entomoplasma ellychniae]|uniref:Uncharacterized protein n=1 Tax=Entomoplasma ellychniae TaxID=2114 RepID=A0A8E2QZX5_9MOLU|nr:hypothetical protein EELLY_v1c06010 [Entomoplasma ellychniae]
MLNRKTYNSLFKNELKYNKWSIFLSIIILLDNLKLWFKNAFFWLGIAGGASSLGIFSGFLLDLLLFVFFYFLLYFSFYLLTVLPISILVLIFTIGK